MGRRERMMIRMAAAKLERERAFRPHFAEGEELLFDSLVRCFRAVAGRSEPIIEGHMVMTDRRAWLVPSKRGRPVIAFSPSEFGSAAVTPTNHGMARVQIATAAQRLEWNFLTGSEPAAHIAALLGPQSSARETTT